MCPRKNVEFCDKWRLSKALGFRVPLKTQKTRCQLELQEGSSCYTTDSIHARLYSKSDRKRLNKCMDEKRLKK